MKLMRYGPPGREKPGLLDSDGKIRDLSGEVDDVGGKTLLPESLSRLAGLDPKSLPLVEGNPRIGACVSGVGKFMCIGLNYSDHAKETGKEPTEHPVLFMKATSAISGPNDDIVLPRGSKHTDWEVELGVVIGTPAKYVSRDEALSHVAGYCVSNDVSERRFQGHLSGQWTKGKSCDSFGPIGPWLVTADEVGDPQKGLSLTLDVNGERRQDGKSSDMIFSVAEIIEHLSSLFTLHPGDVISTGTPSGVGAGMDPVRFLRAGDQVELSISGLGKQTQKVIED